MLRAAWSLPPCWDTSFLLQKRRRSRRLKKCPWMARRKRSKGVMSYASGGNWKENANSRSTRDYWSSSRIPRKIEHACTRACFVLFSYLYQLCTRLLLQVCQLSVMWDAEDDFVNANGPLLCTNCCAPSGHGGLGTVKVFWIARENTELNHKRACLGNLFGCR